jgi:micrococcal nuclease
VIGPAVTRRPRRIRVLTASGLAVLAVLAGCAQGDPSPAPAGGGDGADADGRPARVIRVVDGDTIVARVAGDEERVRLLGVDAPESVTTDRPVECFGPESAAAARRLMPPGARVRLATDASQGAEDRFGRLLAEVTRDGQPITVNEQLVAGGYAEVFRGDGRARLQPALRAAERSARDAGLGLWGSCRR